ncbi:MAG: autotransporter-associated beta strand repeat-containing protein, partial [Devosiaceae bacterium]|nr:autotransporter-associated beta strand repeat-containing protein [Devosiaceae bacterium]
MSRINNLFHGGRIVKYKGQAASYAPSFGQALAPAFKRAALALLSSATIAILATALAPSSALAQNLYWDGSDTVADGNLDGGAGTWNATNTNWATNGGGGTNQAWVADTRAIFSTNFGAVAGIVEIDGDINIDDMYIGSGYELADSDGNGKLIVSDSVFYSQFDGAGTSEISAEIAGTGGVQVSTTGPSVAITLSGNNSFTGKLNVSSKGTVNVTGTIATEAINIFNNGQFLASAGALASGANIYVGPNGAVFTNNGNNTISSIYGWGTFNLAAGTLTTDGDEDNQGIGGDISGGGSLTKQGAGILTLSGNNSAFTGGITVAGGTLSLQNNSAAGTGTITTTGSVIDYGDGINIANLINIDSDTTKLQVLAGTAEQSGIISETNGPRALEKIGAGELILSAMENYYTGTTTISAGTLSLNSNENDAINNSSAVTIGSAGTLNLMASEVIGSLAGSGAVTFSSNQILTAGVDNTDTDNSGLMSSATGRFTKDGTGEMIISGNNNVLSRVDIEGGTLTLTGANFTTSPSGFGFVIDENSTLIANNVGGNAIADSSRIDLVASSSTFEIRTDETIAGISGSGSVILNGGTLTLGTASNWGTGSVFSGTGGGIVKQGTGTLQLSGDNTYTGATTINGGTLNVYDSNGGNSTALGINSAVTVNASGTLELRDGTKGSPNPFTLLIGSLAGAGIVELDANNLSVGGDNTDTDFSGTTTGTGSVLKTDTGTLTLSGANTYTGGTTITAGTLSLTGGAAIADVGAVTVDANGTLNLMTSETIGAMNNAGIINLQNSAIGNNLTIMGNYENTGTLKIDVNNLSASDTLDVTGTVTLGGVLDVFSMGANADYPLGDSFTYTIIENDAADAVSGTFASIESNFAFLDPTINTSGGDGNDVVLTLAHTNSVPDFKPFATNANQSSVAIALASF